MAAMQGPASLGHWKCSVGQTSSFGTVTPSAPPISPGHHICTSLSAETLTNGRACHWENESSSCDSETVHSGIDGLSKDNYDELVQTWRQAKPKVGLHLSVLDPQSL